MPQQDLVINMKIGILRTDDVREELVDEFGEYPEIFERLLLRADPSAEFVAYNVLHDQYPAEIDEVDAYLMTGSKASVYDDVDWIKKLNDFVVTLNERKKKLVGICFGHQLVAHVLGGRTEKSDKGWGIGVHRHELNEEGRRLTGQSSGFEVIVSHQDQVVAPPTNSTVLAGNAFCPIAMCRIDNHILTMQGHPEFETDYARQLYTLRREQLGETLMQEGIDSLAIPVDNVQIAKWIIEFIKE